MISGGKVPGGSCRRIVCETAVTCAFAVSRLAVGCKKIFTIAWPFTVVDSMCSILSTVVVRILSYTLVSRPSSSSGFRPVYCHATAITGMLMLGKMSVGVRRITTGLKIRIKRASTIKVYGRSNATRTIHICSCPQFATFLEDLYQGSCVKTPNDELCTLDHHFHERSLATFVNKGQIH